MILGALHDGKGNTEQEGLEAEALLPQRKEAAPFRLNTSDVAFIMCHLCVTYWNKLAKWACKYDKYENSELLNSYKHVFLYECESIYAGLTTARNGCGCILMTWAKNICYLPVAAN
jgi:hypothetical protein